MTIVQSGDNAVRAFWWLQAQVVMAIVVFNAKNKKLKLQSGGGWVILPDGAFRRKWDLIMTGLLVFIAAFTPYQLAFMRDTSYFNVCHRLHPS